MNWNGQKCHNTLIQAHQRVKKSFESPFVWFVDVLDCVAFAWNSLAKRHRSLASLMGGGAAKLLSTASGVLSANLKVLQFVCRRKISGWWFQRFFIFTPGEMIQFDYIYFSIGLKPPTRICFFCFRNTQLLSMELQGGPHDGPTVGVDEWMDGLVMNPCLMKWHRQQLS